jgi:N-acetylglucosamine-6-phosphate deacetylase
MAIPGELTAIDAALVFDGEAFLPEYSVVISGKTIHSVVPTRQRPDGLATIRLEDGILAPGFIDLQVNGGGGVLLNNCPDLDGIDRIAAAHHGPAPDRDE